MVAYTKPQSWKSERLTGREIRSSLLILGSKDGKLQDLGNNNSNIRICIQDRPISISSMLLSLESFKQEEGMMLHKLRIIGMNVICGIGFVE